MIKFQTKVLNRVFKGTAAAGLEQILNVVIQLISVPLFLYYWGVTLYGEWVLLFTFPAYLAVSDLGFAKAAVNSMTLSCAEQNFEKANSYYHTCFTLLLLFGTLTIALIAGLLYAVPSLDSKLNIDILTHHEVVIVIMALSVYILLFQQAELLRGVISASGKFYYSMTLVGVYRFLEFCAVAGLVVQGFGPAVIAFVFLGFQVVMIVHLIVFIHINFRWFKHGLNATVTYTSLKAATQLLKPALAFMMLPIGYALRTQFPVFLIGMFFNPATIVVYTTARTLTNAGGQLIGALNKAITPEYALAFGSGNLKLVKSIHHNSCNIALGLSTVLVVLLLLFGELFIGYWTQNAVMFDYQLFITLLVSLVVNSLWSTSSYLSYSINQHARQSLFFLLSCAVGGALTFLFIKYYGFSFAAIGILVADTVMVIYVLMRNRRLLNEEIFAFLKNVFRLPSINAIRNI